jgi:hypothetical protein
LVWYPQKSQGYVRISSSPTCVQYSSMWHYHPIRNRQGTTRNPRNNWIILV